MLTRLQRPNAGLVVALIALFVALGGTAGAVVTQAVPLAKRALVADNAKKLGGKTAAQVAALPGPATTLGGKTADALVQQAVSQASQAPGPASTVAGLITVKTTPWSGAVNEGGYRTVTCDAGQKAISGGYQDTLGWTHSWDSYPTPDGTGWTIYMHTSSFAPGPQSGNLYVICLK